MKKSAFFNRDLLQRLITHGVPKGVVDMFKIVNIKHDHSQRRIVTHGNLEPMRGKFEQVTAVVNAGQFVCVRQFFFTDKGSL